MTVNDPRPVRDGLLVRAREVRQSSAAWWIGAIAAAVGILVIAVILSREPAPAPAQQATLMVRPGMTVARSAGPTIGPGKPEAVKHAEQASLASLEDSKRVSNSIVYPPVAYPQP
jgi:hypothetical protein